MRTGESSVLISVSALRVRASSFFRASSRMPRCSSPAHAAARTSQHISPTPAVKTSASGCLPKAATYAPKYFRMRCTSMSKARRASASPFFMAAHTSRRSTYFPVMPSKPDCLLRVVSMSETDMPVFLIM